MFCASGYMSTVSYQCIAKCGDSKGVVYHYKRIINYLCFLYISSSAPGPYCHKLYFTWADQKDKVYFIFHKVRSKGAVWKTKSYAIIVVVRLSQQ